MTSEEILIGLVKANTAALEKVAAAVENNAEKNAHLAKRMDRMVATIAGAQRKIGGELGPIIDQGKAAAATLHKEAEAVVRARDHGGT